MGEMYASFWNRVGPPKLPPKMRMTVITKRGPISTSLVSRTPCSFTSEVIWWFRNQILLSAIEKLNTWSTNGLLFGWPLGVPRICGMKKRPVAGR